MCFKAQGKGSGRGGAVTENGSFSLGKSTAMTKMLRVIHSIQPSAGAALHMDCLCFTIRICTYLNQAAWVEVIGGTAVFRRGNRERSRTGILFNVVANDIR